jgi:hypothetical protein
MLSDHLATVESFGLGAQAWVGEGVPRAKSVAKPIWSPSPRPKPPATTLFTSTWDEEQHTSPWLDFHQENRSEFRRHVRPSERLWILEPVPETTLFVIDTYEAFLHLACTYPHRRKKGLASEAPCWPLIHMAGSFDGVHVTAGFIEGQREHPTEIRPLFRGWDVESTAWFRWPFGQETTMKRILVGPIDPDWRLVAA